MLTLSRNTTLDTPAALASGMTLLELLLAEQQAPTAIERFAQRSADAPVAATRYRDLLPLSAPEAGQQYAFSVDLDSCSGCKSCVTACHQLNGLQQDETWRDVGLLIEDVSTAGISRFVTTACHHCVEPGCLSGCPTQAYEKDPITGIVRHLDDQCFGCQYCTMTCPYHVPNYRPSLGIVRKCDMCRQRLQVGEAPGCVQACPNRAISITVVSANDVRQLSVHGEFLPDAPHPSLTVPTTHYHTADRAQLAKLRAADGLLDLPAPIPGSLVAMLVATQFAVGLMLVSWLLRILSSSGRETGYALSVVLATLTGVVGVHLALLHLGRPQLAYKAWLGWRTSWLSREAIAFGFWMPSAIVLALAVAGGVALRDDWQTVIGAITVVLGLVSVGCSAMIYAATRRPWWSARRSLLRFYLTSVALGAAAAASIAERDDITLAQQLFMAASAALVAKLLLELEPFARRPSPGTAIICRTAKLLTGPLRTLWFSRVAAAILALSSGLFAASATGYLVAAAALVAGEVLERCLFFGAVAAPRMPRSIVT